MLRSWTFLLGLFLSACTAPQLAQQPVAQLPPLEELSAWMSGSFSSATQHQQDPESYHDIALHMQPIWTARNDGPWLYVEQALASKPERPYRQRVYRLRLGAGGEVWSDVYTLPQDPLLFAGAWQEPQRLDALEPGQLALREGCSLRLVRAADGAWSGATQGQQCPSELSGARYATSEARIEAQLLTSWDRGYDERDQQVWGAVLGPYRFVKQALHPNAAGGRMLLP